MFFENIPVVIDKNIIAEFEALTGDDHERYANKMLRTLRTKYPSLNTTDIIQKLAATMQKEIDICKGVL